MSSFGFVRKQSPAARSQAERYRRVTQLKNLSIDEISSVDRGAGEGVSVVLMKRDAYTYTPEPSPIEKGLSMFNKSESDLVAFCKTDQISKAQLSELIETAALKYRKRGESREQAYTAFITADPLGIELYQVMKAAPGLDHHQERAFAKANSLPHKDGAPNDSDDDGAATPSKNPYHSSLEAMVDSALERKEHQGKTRAQIYTHIAQHSPVGQKLMTFATQWDLERRHETGA
jgi:hypothetical protein